MRRSERHSVVVRSSDEFRFVVGRCRAFVCLDLERPDDELVIRPGRRAKPSAFAKASPRDDRRTVDARQRDWSRDACPLRQPQRLQSARWHPRHCHCFLGTMNKRSTVFAAACYTSRSARTSGEGRSAPSAHAHALAWADSQSIVSKHVGGAERQDQLQFSTARQERGRDECGTVPSDHAGFLPHEGPSFSLSTVSPAWSTSILPWIREGGPRAASARPARRFLQGFATGVLLLALSATEASLPAQPMPGSTHESRQTPDPLLGGLSRWDMDFDGGLTCQEWKRYAEQLFRRSDKNGDGVLEREDTGNVGAPAHQGPRLRVPATIGVCSASV